MPPLPEWVWLAAPARETRGARSAFDSSAGFGSQMTFSDFAGARAVAASAPHAGPAVSRSSRAAARAALAAAALESAADHRGRHSAAAGRALDVVREFIAERRRIVYGGTAIDFALRARGRALYADDALPDYDFFTPDIAGDAYDLVERIGAAVGDGAGGLPRLRVVPGIHATTLRVGFGEAGFHELADLGFAPPAVFAAIPTLSHAGVLFVHPDFQRVDLHLALMFPMANPPFEDVFNRARKFAARLAIFDELWPLGPGPGPGPGPATTIVSAALGADVAGAAPAVAIGGFAAYGLLRAALDELESACRAAGAPAPPPVAAPRLAVRVSRRCVEAEIPAAAPPALDFASCAAATAAGPGAIRRRAYLDAGFASFAAADGTAVVESTADRLLAVAPMLAPALVQNRTSAETDAPSRLRVFVLAPPGILRAFALAAVRATVPPARELARAFYAHTVEVVAAAESACAAAGAAGADLFAASPFGPGAALLGGANRTPAYLNSLREAAAAVGDPVAGPPPAPRPAGFAWRGGAGRRPPPFDYASSAHFTHDGGDEPAGHDDDGAALDTCATPRGRVSRPAAGGGTAARASSADAARAFADPDVRRFTARVPPRFW